MAVDLQVVPDEKAAARRAAELISEAGADAVAERGAFSLAMSGGRSPWAMLAILSEDESMPWEQTALFQVDEQSQPISSTVRELWGKPSSLSVASSAPAPSPSVGASRPLDLFSDRDGTFSG